MFYVSGSKIYLVTFDAELEVYPEVKLARVGYDQLGVVKTGGGIAQKPKAYSLCTLAELIAQFGGTVEPAPEAEPETEDEDEGSAEE